ncbi:hypothetical protein DPMN_071892 [Dreissena polymorpha]|uniref:Uncharacterized protein n=1 Tax=Dreissena polymorpha TaxID=45954 RepID=A0A9D3Z5D2_DREPO|nr:hypothetical protein DPMN_071892 [Dreissena polymorpha]
MSTPCTCYGIFSKTCYGVFFTALQRLEEVKFTTMEISFHDSTILDVSMEVVID